MSMPSTKKRLFVLSNLSLTVVLMMGAVAPFLPMLTQSDAVVAQVPSKKKKVVIVDLSLIHI